MTEKEPVIVALTQDQFTALMNKLSEAYAPGNKYRVKLAQCSYRYDGERNRNKVEEFVTSVSLFKKFEKISDEDILEGLTLLLTGSAAIWWSEIKGGIKTWSQALDAIRAAFAPKMEPHEIYLELFSKKQTNETLELFVREKRALLSQLPANRQREEEHLDLVYGLLNLKYKTKITRSEIISFADLIEHGRQLESLEKDTGVPGKSRTNTGRKPIIRCSFCCNRGHLSGECRKRLAEQNKEATEQSEKSPRISCYGCGAPGVFRSICETCRYEETSPQPVSFY